MSTSHAHVNEIIEKNQIRWVIVNFVDIHGEHRNISLPSSAFLNGKAWESVDFDGSSVGFASVDKSDMFLVPDPDSWWIDPFSENTLNLHSSIKNASGDHVGPRSGLLKMIHEYEIMGLVPHISPEMEFYVYESIEQALLENDFMGADMDWGGKNLMHSIMGFYDDPKYMTRAKRAYR